MCQPPGPPLMGSSPAPEPTTTGDNFPLTHQPAPTVGDFPLAHEQSITVGDFLLTHITFSNDEVYYVIICTVCRVTVSSTKLKVHLEAATLPHHNLDQATQKLILRQVIEWCTTTDVPEFEKAPTTQLLGTVPHIPVHKGLACEYCEDGSQRYLAGTTRSLRDHINKAHPGCASHKRAPNVDMQHIGANIRNARWFRVDPPAAEGPFTSYDTQPEREDAHPRSGK